MPRRPLNQPYTISNEFGVPDSRAKFGRHAGVDYAIPVGREIYAPTNGTITDYTWGTYHGHVIQLFDGQYYHRMMHLSKRIAQPGTKVTEGQLVGLSGATGQGITGPHLHWDITRQKHPDSFTFIDPWAWLGSSAPPSEQKVLQPYQRKAGPEGVYEREAPSRIATIFKEWPAGDIFDFKGYVKGENVNGNDNWYVGKYNGRYFWSGAFENKDVGDLPNLTPAPPTTTPPLTPKYSFTKDLDIVTEVIPAAEGCFEYGNFPVSPDGIVLHDFGTDGRDTYQSTVNWFQKPGNIAAHFVVSGKRLTQMVALRDRAYHAGPKGNIFIGVELDPIQDPDTVATGQLLVRELRKKYGKELKLYKHPEFMATSCGDDFDLATYESVPPIVSEDKVKNIEDFLKRTFREF